MLGHHNDHDCLQVACNGGSTPLHLAAMRGDAELVRILTATYVKILEDGLDGKNGIACPDPRRCAIQIIQSIDM
jgi:hypothetical protein